MSRTDRVQARDFADRVTIQAPTYTVDAIGGQTAGAPTLVLENEPAAVSTMDAGKAIGRERLQVGQVRGSVAYLVKVHFHADVEITTAMQVLWSGRTLEIAAVDETAVELWLQCAEVLES